VHNLYTQFFHPGEVVELRAIGLRGKNKNWEGFAGGKGGIVSGYFNDGEKLAAAAMALDAAGARGVYFTANPCQDVLLSRASNRLICPQEEATTPDMYMKCLRWFLIDLDAPLLDGTKRPKGVSASDAEIAVCEQTAKNVAAWLEGEMGFAKAIRGLSGNGFHLMYRLQDLPNDDEHKLIIKNAMAALAEKFGKDTIDVTVVNPGRIWKYYGTTGRKGDSTTDRPHRKSYLFNGQPEMLDDTPVTTLAVLKALAALKPVTASPGPGTPGTTPPVPYDRQSRASGTTKTPPQGTTGPMKKSDLGPLDMERYLTHYGISFDVKATPDATLYRLDVCLFNSDHGKGEASIVVPKKGAIKYQCFHSSCHGKHWKDAKLIISGDKKLAEFCTGYDPTWQPPEQISGPGDLENMPVDRITMMTEQAACVPRPEAINPRWFFEKKGKRPVFVPQRLANYVANYLRPLCHTAGLFYQYYQGVWQDYPRTRIASIIVEALKDEVQAAWIDNTIRILAGKVNREENEWPNNPMMINVKNGMLNLADIGRLELLPHDPSYGSRTQLPVSYRPEFFSPRWKPFLDQVLPGDDNDSKKFLLQQFFGYCLLRDCRFHKALFLYGTGRNGKSTVLDVLQAMVGAENTTNMSLNDLSQRFKPAFLVGKLVNLASETNSREPTSTEIFKLIISGDMIQTERKFGEQFSFRPFAKFIAAMNEPPIVPDKSHGFSSRLIVLNFTRRFEKHEQIPNLSKQLIEDIDYVFTWALEGLKFLLSNGGFAISAEVDEATAQLLTALNPFLVFGLECLVIDVTHTCPTNDLWHAYKGWCSEGKNRPLGRNKFYEQILTQYHDKIKAGNDTEGRRIFRGVKLNDEGEEYAAKARKRSEKFGD
jgi:P4 family phage/plasmid primase-like protien